MLKDKNHILTIYSLTLIFVLSSSYFFGQNDTLNKFNDSGKKNGYWKVILDNNADPIDSIKKAFFYCYELWDNGERVFECDKHTGYDKIVFDGVLPEKGKPELINGVFKWYDKNGLLTSEEIYKQGQPFFIKSYNWDKNNSTISTFNEVLYFDKKLNNIPGTYYYEELFDNGRIVKKYWFRKGKRGWRVYKIKK